VRINSNLTWNVRIFKVSFSYFISWDACASPTEDEIDDIKDRFYDELEQVFDKFPKLPMNILLGDFGAKVGREDIFKPTIGNERFAPN
jgi:hypothetical protein